MGRLDAKVARLATAQCPVPPPATLSRPCPHVPFYFTDSCSAKTRVLSRTFADTGHALAAQCSVLLPFRAGPLSCTGPARMTFSPLGYHGCSLVCGKVARHVFSTMLSVAGCNLLLVSSGSPRCVSHLECCFSVARVRRSRTDTAQWEKPLPSNRYCT